jgi:dephospho-CoA kinase
MAKKSFYVIGFVGKRGCGKDACTKYLARKYKAKELVMSEFISDALKLFFIPQNRKNIPWFITKVRKRFGKGVLARSVIWKIGEDGFSYYLLNGIRLKREVEILQEKFGKRFKLVNLACNNESRFIRINNREKRRKLGKDEVGMSLGDFVKQEKRINTEKEISAIQKKADYIIENNGTKKKLYQALNKLIKQLK